MDQKHSNEQVVNEPISFGSKLATLREKMGLSQQNIAEKIHVKNSMIADIENDNTDDIPAVFIKNHIKAYAKIVNMPESEYMGYLENTEFKRPTYTMKNYSQKEQHKKYSKRLIFFSILIIATIIGSAVYFALKEDKSNLVEVSHYITPSISSSNS